jgi:hydroxymethylbilane synthase
MRSDNREGVRIVAPLNHLPTWQSITAERAFLRALGGGCRAPIAALGTVNGVTLKLEGMISDISGSRILRSSDEGSAQAAAEIGDRLARKLLDMGANEFLAEVGKK